MKFNKLSFIFLTLALVVLVSVGVSANVTTRSLPTIYKVTGDLNLEQTSGEFYYVVAAVDSYAVGKSSCYNYEGMKTQLTNGIFIGPIPYDVVGHTSRSFDLKLILKHYPNESSCTSSNGNVTINVGSTMSGSGSANN